MCNLTQTDETVVQTKVMDFISNKKMFTSVHVANAIKTDGHWVKNSDVAEWLRGNMHMLAPHYQKTSIAVSGAAGPGRASLYHASVDDPTTFTDTQINAMTPDEFKRIHGFDPLTMPAGTTSSTNIKVICYECVSRDNTNRIRIPAKIVKELGLKPFNTVTNQKFSNIFSGNFKSIPSSLRVHSDGRISIPRNIVDIKGDVKIRLKNGIVEFVAA